MYDIQNVRHTKMYDIQKYMTYMCRYISSGCVLKYDVYIATLTALKQYLDFQRHSDCPKALS